MSSRTESDKKTLFLAAAIQGLSTNPELTPDQIAEKAEQIADAVLGESNGEQPSIADTL